MDIWFVSMVLMSLCIQTHASNNNNSTQEVPVDISQISPSSISSTYSNIQPSKMHMQTSSQFLTSYVLNTDSPQTSLIVDSNTMYNPTELSVYNTNNDDHATSSSSSNWAEMSSSQEPFLMTTSELKSTEYTPTGTSTSLSSQTTPMASTQTSMTISESDIYSQISPHNLMTSLDSSYSTSINPSSTISSSTSYFSTHNFMTSLESHYLSSSSLVTYSHDLMTSSESVQFSIQTSMPNMMTTTESNNYSPVDIMSLLTNSLSSSSLSGTTYDMMTASSPFTSLSSSSSYNDVTEFPSSVSDIVDSERMVTMSPSFTSTPSLSYRISSSDANTISVSDDDGYSVSDDDGYSFSDDGGYSSSIEIIQPTQTISTSSSYQHSSLFHNPALNRSDKALDDEIAALEATVNTLTIAIAAVSATLGLIIIIILICCCVRSRSKPQPPTPYLDDDLTTTGVRRHKEDNRNVMQPSSAVSWRSEGIMMRVSRAVSGLSRSMYRKSRADMPDGNSNGDLYKGDDDFNDNYKLKTFRKEDTEAAPTVVDVSHRDSAVM